LRDYPPVIKMPIQRGRQKSFKRIEGVNNQKRSDISQGKFSGGRPPKNGAGSDNGTRTSQKVTQMKRDCVEGKSTLSKETQKAKGTSSNASLQRGEKR